jgi:hypothetical protein
MDGVELIVRNYGMSISKTGHEVIRFQIRNNVYPDLDKSRSDVSSFVFLMIKARITIWNPLRSAQQATARSKTL